LVQVSISWREKNKCKSFYRYGIITVLFLDNKKSMKTMTCAQMGGPCDHPITAETSEEMMGLGMQHIEDAHPEMAADIKAMPADAPAMVAWSEKFHKDWDATPENE
jgi:predicted small metal-binding protein